MVQGSALSWPLVGSIPADDLGSVKSAVWPAALVREQYMSVEGIRSSECSRAYERDTWLLLAAVLSYKRVSVKFEWSGIGDWNE